MNRITIIVLVILLPIMAFFRNQFTVFLSLPKEIQAQTNSLITLDAGMTYQTMTGWVAVAQIGQDWAKDRFHLWQDTVIDQAANDLGINHLKANVISGFENPNDYFTQYLTGKISYDEWKSHWQDVINDNNDPFVINPSGFQFSQLDHQIDKVVLPLKNKLAAKGEKLTVYIVYAGADTTQHADYPEEYAELVLATYQHLENKYGWVPDGWIVHNEPKRSWNVTKLGNALVAAGNRLRAHGYDPVMVAPEYVNVTGAISWFNQLMGMPGVPQYLKVFSYHRYGGQTDANLQIIGNLGIQHGVETAMLEKYNVGGDYHALHKDLKLARVSSWEQFALAFPAAADNGAQYYWIDESNPANPQVKLGSQTKFLRQYFKFVRSGSVRIAAASNDGRFDPVVFINADGKYVAVVKATAGGSFEVQGLPAGTYGIKYTTSNQYDVDLVDQVIKNGQRLSASIPAAGVITVFQKSSASPTVTPTLGPTLTPMPTPTPTQGPSLSPTPTLPPCLGPGDVNCDQAIDNQDMKLMLQAWLTNGTVQHQNREDSNHDGQVNTLDAAAVVANWSGEACQLEGEECNHAFNCCESLICDAGSHSCRTVTEAEKYFQFQQFDESFCLYVDNDQAIKGAWDTYQGMGQYGPQGPVVRDGGDFNYGYGCLEKEACSPEEKGWRWWTWHFDPVQVIMTEASVEVCDGTPSAVEYLWTEGRIYCPWSTQIVSLGCSQP